MNITSRIGVSEIQLIVSRQFKWIFREISVEDNGIDAQIEIANKINATGKLIAVQIKSGSSYFNEIDASYVTFRFDMEHFEYWKNSSLPVIIVLYNPDTEECIWEIIDDDNVQKVSKDTCKINIPRINKFDNTSINKLKILAYKENMVELIKEIKESSVDPVQIYSEMNNKQKAEFIKAIEKFDEKNAATSELSLVFDIRLLDLLPQINKKNYLLHKTVNYLNESIYSDIEVNIELTQSQNKALENSIDFINTPNSKMLLIIGEAGIGKTVVIKELNKKYINSQNLIFINGYDIYHSSDIISQLETLLKGMSTYEGVKVIVIDGWKESVFFEHYSLNKLYECLFKLIDVRVIVTSRPINEKLSSFIKIFTMKPLTINESVSRLKVMGLINDNESISNDLYSNLSGISTPLLLNSFITACQNAGLSIENANLSDILFKLLTKYDSQDLNILGRLAFEMWKINRFVMNITDKNALEILCRYHELLINEQNVSFLHMSFYEIFIAEFMFSELFNNLKFNKNYIDYANKIFEIFSAGELTISIFDYLKFIVRKTENIENIFDIELFNKSFGFLLKQGMITIHEKECIFNIISRVFYSTWHLASFVNKHILGYFKVDFIHDLNKELVCIIGIFNKIYFNDKYLDFSNTDFSNMNFNRCNGNSINFNNSILHHANFLACSLEFCNFENADMSYCNLLSANLRYANLCNVNLTGANVSNCMVCEENLKFILPYKDTLKYLDKLIVITEDKRIMNYGEYDKFFNKK